MGIGSLLLAIVADAKVAENDVALAVQEDVFGLDVAVDNPARVKVLDGENDFGDVKTSDALGMDARRCGVLPRKSLCRLYA